ncbi:energy transducer TonB [Allocoleopsis franciscana]|uniref:TonB family protein n=1 Tax=Allocoleopsis franciscana PCC 7113 TaxID=1173027 RepID=K9WC33_9CYAN|nr:energy transducer TonB [Allocoleopsis franciscana]AFZ17324.1 TonB family protein [Allocoleopsis franciscana PCC 7113]
MSYASSSKSFPDFLKTLPHKLSQPTAIAVIASVGIHAALGFSLPYFSTSSQEKPKPIRNVQLLELKPEELSRVPPSPLPLDPLSPSLNQQLTPLSPSGSSTFPSLPSFSSNTPSLGDLPSFDPLPSLGGSGNVPGRATNLGKLARNSPVRTQIKRNPGEPPLPSEVFNSQGGKSSANPQFKIATGSKITSSPNLRPDVGGLTRGLLPANDNLPLLERFNSNQTSRSFPPPPPAGAIAVNPGVTGTPFQNQVGATPSMSAFGQTTQATAPASGQGSLTSETATRNFNAFVQRQEDWKKRHQVSGELQELPLTVGKYPEKARAAGVDRGSLQVNWMVDKNGNIIADSLEIIGSSGDGVFDEEALAAVRKLSIPATGQDKAYTVRVIFYDDSAVPGSVTGSPNSTDGKNSADRQNLPQRLTPTDRQNSPQRLSPAEQLTPPEQRNSPEWSTPSERKIPSVRPNSSEQPNPTEGKNPTEQPNSSQQPNPTEEKKPTQPLTPPKGENSTERSTPTEQISPPKRENSTERSTPTEQISPPKRENSTERSTPTEQISPPKRENSTERSTPTERISPPKRENSTERSTPTERISPPKRENSTEPRSSSESQNSEKPQKLPQPQSSEKPQRLPQLPNSVKP